MSYDDTTNTPADKNDTAVPLKVEPKAPPKPNRKDRRRYEALVKKANKAKQKSTENRSRYYSLLQEWLAGSTLPKELADEAFKRTLTKLFKKDFKSETEFMVALDKSIKFVTTTALSQADEGLPQE